MNLTAVVVDEGRSIRVEMADECPGCDPDIDVGFGVTMDLSRAAHELLTGDLSKGVIPIEWDYV